MVGIGLRIPIGIALRLSCIVSTVNSGVNNIHNTLCSLRRFQTVHDPFIDPFRLRAQSDSRSENQLGKHLLEESMCRLEVECFRVEIGLENIFRDHVQSVILLPLVQNMRQTAVRFQMKVCSNGFVDRNRRRGVHSSCQFIEEHNDQTAGVCDNVEQGIGRSLPLQVARQRKDKSNKSVLASRRKSLLSR